MTLEGHEPVGPLFPDGKMERTTMKHVSSICYFPDGKQLMSGSDDKTARQWDLQAQKEVKEARDVRKQEVCAVEVSRDGRWVVTASGSFGSRHGELRVCEVETGIVKSFSEGHAGTISIDISLDSTLLASASSDGTVWIKSLKTGDLEATIQFQNSFNSRSMGAVRFSQDSKKLAIKSSTAHCLEVWDVQAETCLRRGPVRSPGGMMTNAPMFWTSKDKTIVTAFSFNVSNSTSDRDLETIYEFDASTLKKVGTPFEGHTSLVTGLALSFDCALLASAANDQTIKLWAFESRQLLASFDVQYPRCIIFSPDSRQLVYTAWAKIHICDVSSDILSGILPVQQEEPSTSTSAAGAPHFADLFNSNATPPAVRQRKDADDDLICDEDYVPPSRDSQPLPTGQLTSGEHGSGRWCFCF
ncbi:WD40 repeat-like protein [Suillus weaverae]|nr:WD40 repeat-like protein [Suillus weaverae]